ncbi:MAG TPA: pilus assembly protein TadG-related protein [Terracidiphilus sp.]|nr:pilus assembly protein TadG-related protein [Terracidiphilus sp.]
MRIRKDESGQVLVMTVLSMVVLLGFMALALDVGLLFRAKRNQQIGTDAAAMAAALDYYHTGSTTSSLTMGAAAGTANGVTNGTNGATVAIHMPPSTGPYAGMNGAAEAIVIKPNPTVFMKIFNLASVNVATRAVAAPVGTKSCIYLMNETGTDLSIQGSSTITGPNGQMTCGVYSNSTGNCSVNVTGQGNTINTSYVATMGGLCGAGNSNTTPTPTTTNLGSLQSPPAGVNYAFPSPASLSCAPPSGGKTVTIGGNGAKSITYTVLSAVTETPQTIAVNYNGSTYNQQVICYSGNVMLQGTSSAPLTMTDNVLYVFSGNYVDLGNYVGSAGHIPTVTLDINNGVMNVNPTTSVFLQAPTSGAYNGAVLIAPPSNINTWNVQWGSANGDWDGLIVAQGVNLYLNDQGGSVMTTGLVVGSLTMQTGTVIVNNYNVAHVTSPLNTVTLVE